MQGKGDAVTGATDPWRAVGSGMRLDGKSTTSNSNNIEDLTEDEMLQMALAASMEPARNTAIVDLTSTVELTEEPPAGTAGAVRIQFRFPDGSRAVRRFLQSDPVGMVYAFVDSEVKGGQGKAVELRAGFPPKDLKPLREKSIAEASLSGETIHCRFA